MAARGGRSSKGRSSSGRSSGGSKSSGRSSSSSSRGKSSSGSKSSSAGRSSSKSSAGRSSAKSSSGKKSTASKSSSRTRVSTAARSKTTSRLQAVRRTSVGTPARKVVTKAPKRTTKTVSPLKKMANRPMAKAQPTKRKPIVVTRRPTRTVSPPVYKKKVAKKTAPVSNITKGASFGALQQAQARQSAQTNFNNQILGRKTASTTPVRVNFPSGDRMMYLGAPAIRAYEAQGLKVTGVSMTIKNGTMYPTPPIPRIRDQTDRWANNPPPLLTVPKRTQAKAPSPRGQNNIFKQQGSNPNSNIWNPLDSLAGMFDTNPQEAPSSQYLPPADTFDYPRPVYEAFANDQGFYQSPQPVPNFNKQIQTDTFDAKAEIQKLIKSKYALYAGIAIAALIGIKIVLR